MSKKLTAAAIPPLQLSEHDERELRALSAQLERELLTQYEQFLFRDQRSIDATRWKHTRSDGDVHAYKERPLHKQQQLKRRGSVGVDDPHAYTYHKPVDATSNKKNVELLPPPVNPQQTLAEQSPLPRVLVTGTITGTLDDIMYGCAVQDTPSLQAFWASQNERMEESAVVAKLDGATIDDPYQFLGVIWFLRTFPLNLRQRRDLLTLSFSHTTKLSNGERVGIDVGHSIQHRDLAELHEFNTIRATSSILKVFRQLDETRVEVFMIQFLDTKGCVTDCRHVAEATRHMLPLATSASSAGFRKKLQYMMRQRDRDHLAATPCDAIEPQSSGSNDACELCDRTIGTLFSCPGTSCQLCYKRVCSRCSVAQDLAVAVSATKTVVKPSDFCIQCMLRARALSTRMVAREEALHRSRSDSSSTSSTASRSSSNRSSGTSKQPRERMRTTLMSADAALCCS